MKASLPNLSLEALCVALNIHAQATSDEITKRKTVLTRKRFILEIEVDEGLGWYKPLEPMNDAERGETDVRNPSYESGDMNVAQFVMKESTPEIDAKEHRERQGNT